MEVQVEVLADVAAHWEWALVCLDFLPEALELDVAKGLERSEQVQDGEWDNDWQGT